MKVCILGFGVEGESAINFYLKRKAEVFVYDQKPYKEFSKEVIEEFVGQGVRFDFGQKNLAGFDFDLVLRSPGIALDSNLIASIQSKKIPLSSTTKIFFESCPCPIIGVTGTKGKGTTASLIFEMAKMQGKDVYLGGNIGNPPLNFLDKLTKDSLVVLELSSFQLEDLDKSPHIAVVLMTSEDHLEVHQTVENYLRAKFPITKYQTQDDLVISNVDYPGSQLIASHSRGAHFGISTKTPQQEGCFIENEQVMVSLESNVEAVTETSRIFIPGEHNLENVCAATMTAKLLGIENPIIAKVLAEFKGLPHRLEFVREVGGVRYFDDSFATSPDPTIAAIRAFKSPKILILGGSSKNSDFSKLAQLISQEGTVKGIVGVGVEWPKIKEALGTLPDLELVEGCNNMQEIVNATRKVAKSGDVVLLSPSCASFDMFKNYKDRGDQFKKYVREL